MQKIRSVKSSLKEAIRISKWECNFQAILGKLVTKGSVIVIRGSENSNSLLY